MDLMDLCEKDGPYWAAYQAARERDGILDNPDFVPSWFVAKLARDRIAAARVAMEQLHPESNAEHDTRHKLWRSLRLIEDAIREGHTLDPTVAQLVAGLLGAQEVAADRERRDAEAATPCTREASCEPGDHTYSWPCDFAPGTGSLR